MSNCILAEGANCRLRKLVRNDFDWFWEHQNIGKWTKYDAPWEESFSLEEYEKHFNSLIENTEKGKISRTVIEMLNGEKIGTVNRYAVVNNNESAKIGIDIYIDEYMNKGYGKEALGIWINYLICEERFHRIGLDTYSFNSSMIKVALNCNMKLEGIEREIRKWENEWIDLYHFGLISRNK